MYEISVRRQCIHIHYISIILDFEAFKNDLVSILDYSHLPHIQIVAANAYTFVLVPTVKIFNLIGISTL